jgi:hypothetical protein
VTGERGGANRHLIGVQAQPRDRDEALRSLELAEISRQSLAECGVEVRREAAQDAVGVARCDDEGRRADEVWSERVMRRPRERQASEPILDDVVPRAEAASVGVDLRGA